MKEKLERVIAALQVEAAMIELHAQRLLEMVPSLAGDQQRHEMLQLAKEETDRAEAIKRQMLGFAMIAGSVGIVVSNRSRSCESVGLAGHLARSVAVYCLYDGDIPSRPFHKPVLECNRGQHGILVPCRRSLSPGFCAATERSGARRRTLPQELGARPIQSSKAKAVLDSWDGLRLISCLAGVRPLSTKSGFRLDDGQAGVRRDKTSMIALRAHPWS
jgi:hypothetical protein